MKIINLFINIFLFNSIKCYFFTVIIPIYNAARYLDDSIGSVINQTIGFNHIQLILINDGSIDNTENICLKYQKNYNENIIYIKLNHGGVSKARNEGLKHAKGLYINFLDSDDKWDLQAFKNIYSFFEINQNIDIVAGRIKNFELNDRYQYIDYKFKKTKVVNLTEDFNFIQFSAASCFIRASSLNNNKFDEEAFFAEDVKLINTILLDKPLLGVVREAVYNCRKRSDSTSASQVVEENRDFYFKTIDLVLNFLIAKSKRLYNNIQPFLQFYIAYEILFRIAIEAYKYLDLSHYNIYCKIIVNLLQQIEDKYILNITNFHPFIILFALSKKYKKDLRYDMILKNDSLYYLNYEMINLSVNRDIIILNFLENNENKLHLECEDRFWMPKETFSYFIQIGNNTYFPNYLNYSNYKLVTMFGVINKGRSITYDIPLEPSYEAKEGQIIHFYICYNKVTIEIFPSIGRYTHIPPISDGYYIIGNYILKNLHRNLIVFERNNYLIKSFEKKYCNELHKIQKYEIIEYRKEYMKTRKNYFDLNKETWIINDRKNQAGDNGEYFFRYLKNIKPKNINYFFVIEKNCSDYERLKNYDNIIDYHSTDYLNLFLRADKIISSVSDSWVSNPFGTDGIYVRDLFHFDFIYLNNGIIKDELSMYLNKIEKNFNLFIVSSKSEYLSLLNPDYGYNKDNILLTGMPRLDNLKKLEKNIQKKNIILIFPSWRNYIRGTLDIKTHESIQSDRFINTSFFNFYNDLINDKQLLEEMNNNKYIGIFCLHPNFAQQYRYFKENKLFKVKSKCFEQELLVKSSLLITDYSSIFFDFAYIRKPIIYSQFDIKDYRKNQYPQGYFNYEQEGFGPICYDLQCTIRTIIYEIRNRCEIKELYSNRIKNFFQYFDDQNSYRLYNQLINYNNKSIIINSVIREKLSTKLFLITIICMTIKGVNYFIKKF